MRGAGCVLNDIVDRDFDAWAYESALQLTRPILSGQGQCRLRPCCSWRCWWRSAPACCSGLNRLAILLGLAILAVVALYPFMKRVTHWPQIFLGLNFNWGVVIAWAAATGRLGAPALALYAGGIAWTLFYDTIYAHSDKADDVEIGVKSTALRLGGRARPGLPAPPRGEAASPWPCSSLGRGAGATLSLVAAALHFTAGSCGPRRTWTIRPDGIAKLEVEEPGRDRALD